MDFHHYPSYGLVQSEVAFGTGFRSFSFVGFRSEDSFYVGWDTSPTQQPMPGWNCIPWAGESRIGCSLEDISAVIKLVFLCPRYAAGWPVAL